MQNGILLVAGIVFALMEWSYSREITRYETEKESVATEWVSSSNSNCFKQKFVFFFFLLQEMQTISSKHNNTEGSGRGSWEYYERKNPTLMEADAELLNNKRNSREYLT